MRPTAEFLQQFTSRQKSKYLLDRPVVGTVDGKECTYATDGHRIRLHRQNRQEDSEIGNQEWLKKTGSGNDGTFPKSERRS